MSVRATIGVLALALGAGHRAASQESVELAVLHTAAIVRTRGAPHLVHELWITNRLTAAVTVNRVAVLDGDRTLAAYQDDALRALVGRPGLPRTHPAPLVLERGQPAVVYFWIRLDPNAAPPAEVRHRVLLHEAGSDSPRPLILEGGGMLVSTVEPDVLDPPLRGDGWAAIYDPSMMGGHRTAIYTVDGKPRIPGRFAIDFIRLLPTGRAHTDAASRPADWNGFGAEVLAVADARVAAAVDGRPDADDSGKPREAIARENAAGNYIALDLGNGRFAFYEHLQQKSLSVKAGDRVARGQAIARVGSSGSVSSGPHLHFHVADAGSPLGAEGMPFVFRVFHLRGAFPSIDAFARGDAYVPAAAEVIWPVRERPGPNAVVEFRTPPP